MSRFAWAGSLLLFLASAQVCHSLLSARFPWESSLLLFAVAGTTGALALRQFANDGGRTPAGWTAAPLGNRRLSCGGAVPIGSDDLAWF